MEIAMSRVELVGHPASALVFATFHAKAMPALRLVAIASNVAFIVYGHLGGLMRFRRLRRAPQRASERGGRSGQERPAGCWRRPVVPGALERRLD
jgi:hypothetical protein